MSKRTKCVEPPSDTLWKNIWAEAERRIPSSAFQPGARDMNSYLKLLLNTPPLLLHLLYFPFSWADLQTFCHRTLLPACHSLMQKHADARLSCRVRWPELRERGNGSKRVAVAFWCQISESRLLSPFSQHAKRFKPTSLDAAALVPSLQPQSRLHFLFFKVRRLTISSYCVVS